MRSAPTLKIWMTPLASVAMLEKLALLKIALCRAPVSSRASWRRIQSTSPALPGSASMGAGSLMTLGMAFFHPFSDGRRVQLEGYRPLLPVHVGEFPQENVGHRLELLAEGRL